MTSKTNSGRSLFLLLTAVWLALSSCEKKTYPVPDFSLEDVNGYDISLYAALERGPVVIITWALWCKMSIKQLDALKPYTRELHSYHIHILAISQDGAKAAPRVKTLALQHEWTEHYYVLYDTATTVRELFDTEGLPATIALDQNGEVAFRRMGYQLGDEVSIVDTLRALFGQD